MLILGILYLRSKPPITKSANMQKIFISFFITKQIFLELNS